MRVLIAPDKFKGTMTAPDVAVCIALGVEAAATQSSIALEIDECPLADGGEGTLDVLELALRARRTRAVVAAPSGGRILVRAGEFVDVVEGVRTALIESSESVGRRGVDESDAGPMGRTTFGLGEHIARLLKFGARRVIVALGGTSTVDGGIGMAQALGWRFEPTPVGPLRGRDLLDIRRMEPPMPGSRGAVPCLAIADVRNPLLGSNGAARIFGPQKGATPGDVERLEAGLEHLVEVCRRAGLACDPDAEGAGAGGGLGFGMATFLGARLARGVDFVLDALDFDSKLRHTDLVITGEGRLDAQTLNGKVVMGVAQRAARLGVPVLAVPGGIGAAADELRARFQAAGAPLSSITPASDGGVTDAAALAAAAERAFRAWLESRPAKP